VQAHEPCYDPNVNLNNGGRGGGGKGRNLARMEGNNQQLFANKRGREDWKDQSHDGSMESTARESKLIFAA